MVLVAVLVLALAWFQSRPASSPLPVAKPTGALQIVEPPPAVAPTPTPDPAISQPNTADPLPLERRAAKKQPEQFRRDFSDPLVPASIPDEQTTVVPASSDPAMAGDFDKISLMLRDYRTITGENPVGTNAEIMKSIMGGNPKGAMLGPPEGQSVNAAGELIDQWGTPYFFHQLTRDLMEIRSAGPDRKMWTGDDLSGR
jgi:hypothetical protein